MAIPLSQPVSKVFRHSSAHLLATAVLELFPETKLGHGPPPTKKILFLIGLRTSKTAEIKFRLRDQAGRGDPVLPEPVILDIAESNGRLNVTVK